MGKGLGDDATVSNPYAEGLEGGSKELGCDSELELRNKEIVEVIPAAISVP